MLEVFVAGVLAFVGSAVGAFIVDRRQRDRRWDERRIEAMTAAVLGVKAAQGKTWAFVNGAVGEAPPGGRPEAIDTAYHEAFYALRRLGLLVPQVELQARALGDMLDPLYRIAVDSASPEDYRANSKDVRADMDRLADEEIVPEVRRVLGIKSTGTAKSPS